MATVINNPATGETSNNTGLIVGIILLLAIVLLVFYVGLPAIRGTGGGTTINSPSAESGAPADSGSGINVPDQIDVNVQNPQGQ